MFSAKVLYRDTIVRGFFDASYAQLNGYIQDVCGAVVIVNQELDVIDGVLEDVCGAVVIVNQELDVVNGVLEDVCGAVVIVNQELDVVNGVLEDVCGAVVIVNQSINTLNNTVGDICGAIISVNQSITTLREDVDDVCGAVVIVNQELNTIDAILQDVCGAIVDIYGSVGALTDVSDICGAIVSINQSIVGISGEIGDICGAITNIHEDINALMIKPNAQYTFTADTSGVMYVGNMRQYLVPASKLLKCTVHQIGEHDVSYDVIVRVMRDNEYVVESTNRIALNQLATTTGGYYPSAIGVPNVWSKRPGDIYGRTSPTAKYGLSSYIYDAIDGVSTDTLTLTGGWSIAFWWKQSADVSGHILYARDMRDSGNIVVRYDNGNLRFTVNNTTLSTPITPTNWNHIGIQWDYEELRYYVNGTLSHTVSSAPTWYNAPLQFGSVMTKNGFIAGNGNVDDIRVYYGWVNMSLFNDLTNGSIEGVASANIDITLADNDLLSVEVQPVEFRNPTNIRVMLS
jgi:hypothetical protein